MAKFDDLTITNNGLDMIALSQSGAKLIFTKIKLGDGQITNQDITKLNDVISEKMSTQISSLEKKSVGEIVVKFTVDNTELTSGFFVREIGIYAKINDGGEEKLYAYTNAGNYTNYLADKNTPIDAIVAKINLAVGNATNINFILDKSVIYVTLEDLESNLQKHNSNADAHEPAFNKHNADLNAHNNLFNKKLDKTGGTLTGDLNASEHNITATKFIGVLQGIADTATKATQDKNGLQIDTNYLKLAGGSMQGLLNLFANSTIPTPAAQDKSTKVVNSEWVQAWVKSFVSELSINLQVETQEDGHFSCPALGITGLIAQNGYICLGKLFGNLILQWGKGIFRDEKEKIFSLNIAFSSNGFIAVATDVGSGCYRLGIDSKNKNDLHVWVIPENNEPVVHGVDFYWIAIGK